MKTIDKPQVRDTFFKNYFLLKLSFLCLEKSLSHYHFFIICEDLKYKIKLKRHFPSKSMFVKVIILCVCVCVLVPGAVCKMALYRNSVSEGASVG